MKDKAIIFPVIIFVLLLSGVGVYKVWEDGQSRAVTDGQKKAATVQPSVVTGEQRKTTVAGEIRVLVVDVTSIDMAVMTTGGSVYTISVHSKTEDPINIWIDVQSGPEKLNIFAEEIIMAFGTGKTLIAKDVVRVEQIHTTEGVRSGWTVSIQNVSIE